MLKRVYKYTKPVDDVIEFKLPYGAEILHVDTQNDSGDVCLWALVDPLLLEDMCFVRKIRIAGTGHNIEQENLRYINTFTVHNKALWFHAFEILS